MVKKTKKSKGKAKAKRTKAKPARKSKVKAKVTKQNEVTAKRQARKELSAKADLYKVYTKLLSIIKQSTQSKDKIVKGSTITFWGDRAKVILSANSKEVRLYYAVGMKKRYRESPQGEGTLVFAHSSNLFTVGVQSEIGTYLYDIFNKYAENESEERVVPEATTQQVVDDMFNDVSNTAGTPHDGDDDDEE